MALAEKFVENGNEKSDDSLTYGFQLNCATGTVLTFTVILIAVRALVEVRLANY